MKGKRPARYKLAFRNKSAPARVEICRRIINAFKKAPAERLRFVRLNELIEKLAQADGVLAAIPGQRAQLRASLRQRDQIVAALCLAVNRDSKGYVNMVNFDAPAMLAGGLELVAPWRRQAPPGAPSSFRAQRGADVGSAALRWKRPVRYCTFLVESTTDPKAMKGWKQETICTQEKCLLKKLQSGRLHWFRVCAVSARGHSPWSQPVALRPG